MKWMEKLNENIKKTVRSWLNVIPANPYNFQINEMLDFEGHAIRNRIWYRGDSNELEQFYQQNSENADRHKFWASKCMEKAETAVLRMANDQYRKIIYNAQVYANTGAATYETAVDMATKDFLKAGLNCIQYANGARHTIADYADMAIRTASKRAYLQGEGQMRQEWGLHLVIMNKRGCPCPKCLPFVGKIMIDDVWSGGSRKDGKYPLMSSAIAAGLYHPRCKDSHTTYFPGITKADPKYNKQELSDLEAQAQQEAKQQYAARQEKKFERMADFSLDPENQQKYKAKQKEWNRQKETIEIPTSTQDRRSTAKSEITDMHMRQDILEKQLESAKETEKALTQKVYFDMTGTPEEMERLKQAQEQKKIVESSLSDLKDQVLSKQENYKNEVEKQLIEDGILETVKFSRKMKPETVDELESTIRNLHQKYGIMPKAVIYSPAKVEDATATYNWIDDTIYISNNFNDPEKYLEKARKSERSLTEYNEHYGIKNKAKQTRNEAERILTDKTVKGYEKENARIQKAEAEIQLNETRMAVRENVTDCFVHEYGHFIHRHADVDYIQKKSVYGMKELGGSLRNDWVYDINKHYSAKGKIAASSISRYAAKNPYETFAEGFLAMEKGEKIPEQIEKVIANAKKKAGVKSIAKSTASGIMKLPKYENSVIPRAKFTEYALNPAKDPNKAKAFEMALGYTTQNADHLIEQIRSNLPLYQAIEKGDRGYGMTYEVIMDITGPNGKTAKVLTAWIDDRSKGEMRLTTVHVD